MKNLKKSFILMVLVALAMQMAVVRVHAASPADIVINEIAWAGTADSTSDEWIELYNSSNAAVDLTGWTVEDDGTSTYLIEAGTIPAYGYFVIEDSEIALDLVAGAVVPVSLANAGDSLVLKDASGTVIDTVNSSGGAWYAGTSTPKATMERVDPSGGDLADNWATATNGNGAVGRLGTAVMGTPGSVNSVYSGSGPVVSISDPGLVNSGETLVVNVEVDSVSDLYAYGLEVNYDPTVLNFVSAVDSGALTGGAFNYALEDGVEGTLVVGNARLMNPPTGVDVAGTLVELSFSVVGADGAVSAVSLGGTSYLANSVGDVLASFDGINIEVGAVTGGTDPITGLAVSEGAERYSLELSWSAPASGADTYTVMMEDVAGNYLVIGSTAELSFIDNVGLVPGLTYNYQVFAVKDGVASAVLGASGVETRGVLGDLDRSDRVDGRDIERLARAFASEYGDEEYDALCDTNYDGVIDGSDLIDLGVNFGVTY